MKVYLITGGTGSLGKILTKKILSRKDGIIRIFSRDEQKQNQMQQELEREHGSVSIHDRCRFILGDIRDRLKIAWAARNVTTLIHCAALKIVPALEYNPDEGIKTNIIGSMNVMKAAVQNNVDKAILISSDKAVEPINLYGATKLVAEKSWVAQRYSYLTRFSVVRYGNVIGSRGSVFHVFNESKKLPITDPSMTRFWWTLDQASDFVLKCEHIMEGGEIFVPKLKSRSVGELAKLIHPNKEWEIMGIRSGEKQHESLISRWEDREDWEDYFIVRGTANDTAYSSDNSIVLSDEEMKGMI